MIGYAILAVITLVAGCGRIWFDPRADAGTTIAGDSAGDDGALPVCAHTFCDDFDRDPPLDAGWDMTLNSGAALLSLATDSFVSTPKSYLLELPDTSLETAWLEKQLGAATTSAIVRLQLGWETSNGGTAEIDLVHLDWATRPAGCTSFGYYLVRDGTGPFNLQETYGGCGGNVNNYFTNLDNTGFHDIVMTVTFGPIGTARVKLEIDGATVHDQPTTHAIEPSALSLRVGGGAVRNVVAPWRIRYDDIYVDLL